MKFLVVVTPPSIYHNSLFDRNVTVWWINNVFWTWYLKHHGDVTVILLLKIFYLTASTCHSYQTI